MYRIPEPAQVRKTKPETAMIWATIPPLSKSQPQPLPPPSHPPNFSLTLTLLYARHFIAGSWHHSCHSHVFIRKPQVVIPRPDLMPLFILHFPCNGRGTQWDEVLKHAEAYPGHCESHRAALSGDQDVALSWHLGP